MEFDKYDFETKSMIVAKHDKLLLNDSSNGRPIFLSPLKKVRESRTYADLIMAQKHLSEVVEISQLTISKIITLLTQK